MQLPLLTPPPTPTKRDDIRTWMASQWLIFWPVVVVGLPTHHLQPQSHRSRRRFPWRLLAPLLRVRVMKRHHLQLQRLQPSRVVTFLPALPSPGHQIQLILGVALAVVLPVNRPSSPEQGSPRADAVVPWLDLSPKARRHRGRQGPAPPTRVRWTLVGDVAVMVDRG